MRIYAINLRDTNIYNIFENRMKEQEKRLYKLIY